jgi:DNA polymerase-3 subunit delta
MKFTNLRAFEKHIEGATPSHFSSLYIVLGKEAFQRKTAVDKLVAAMKGNPSTQREFDFQSFESDQLSSKELMQELNAFVLFASKRAVLLEDAEKLDKESMGILENYFDKPNRSVCLILSAATLHHGSNFYKKAEKIGIVLEFVEEKAWEKERSIPEWIATTVAAEGKSIDATTCRHLVKLLGTQQELIHSELQKLFCYIGTRKQITMADVSAIVSSVPVETGFQLGEAIFRCDGTSALRICKGLLLDDTPFIVLLRQLRSQFQTGYQVSAILAQGGGPSEITQLFPYMKGAILERQITFAQSYGKQSYKAGILKIDEIELQAKNSGLTSDFLAELLIVRLVTRNF